MYYDALNKSCNNDQERVDEIIKLLLKAFKDIKRVGWLSLDGEKDIFVNQGGAWVCVNFIWSVDAINNPDELKALCITVFSHHLGAGLQNITSMGRINFQSEELWMVRLQADGSYIIYRNDKKFTVKSTAEVISKHSNERAQRFSEVFGITI